MTEKTQRSEICRSYRGIVALQFLQVSCLSDMCNKFYESSKLKNWMCELCTLSQIRSHFMLYYLFEIDVMEINLTYIQMLDYE